MKKNLKDGRQCVLWKAYELEILGEARAELDNLKHIFTAWMSIPESRLAYADIFDLGRYSDRIDGIGIDKKYVSPYIARKSDEDEWVPGNIEFGFTINDAESESIEHIPLDQQDRETIQAAINNAKSDGLDEVVIPGVKKPISINDAQDILENIESAEQDVSNGEFHATKIKPSGQTLLLKSNIDHVDYLQDRQQTLELSHDKQPDLPASLRPSIRLKQHQLQGVAWLQNLWNYAPDYCRGALLADDMGLGKTLQILTFMARCFEDNPDIEPMLVVAPVSLLENWQEEIEKFFQTDSLPILMLYGANLREKKLQKSEIDPQLVSEGLVKFLSPNWAGNAKIVLTTYETLRDLEFSLAAQPWSIMVCDEAQKIKNPNALVTRSAKKQNVRFKIACTGTPVENSLADLWCLFDFIQPGLLGALNHFGSRYRRPIEAKTEEEQSRLNELRALIEPQTLRRTKAQVAKDLPSKIEDNSCRSLPISPFQRQLYIKAIQSYQENKTRGLVGNHLALIQYLRQLCTSPCLPGHQVDVYESVADYEVKSPKLKWLLETLKTIQQRGEKVIVFVEFLDLQRQLQAYIAQRFGVLPDIINGTTSAAASAVNSRQKRIRVFQERPGFGVIILSPLAVGFGVNIQAANHVIHYSRTWNPAKEDQATDRAYRIGQTKDVIVYYPVITAEFVTFDMKLDNLLSWKRNLSDDMLNGCGDLSGSDFEDIVAPEGVGLI
ncbi:MAG: DEAD/DEAH box helicase [Methylococcaceae bacterium]